MSLKLIKILIIFLYLNNLTTFGDNHENITLAPLPFNYTPEPRAVGGYRPDSHTLAKYVVSLRKTGETEETFGFTHFCAGSIIEANQILTAAHCVFTVSIHKPSEIMVVAKNSKRMEITPETEVIGVKKIVYHSKYPGANNYHDIAILVLVKDIQLDGELAAKISLPQHDIQEGKLCTVVGWGQMYMDGPLANNLVYSDLNLLSRKHCRKTLPDISGRKLCALNKRDKGMDACKGDSGGPLICSNGKDIIVGVISYGYGCGKGNPSVYTNVYRYVDWIKAGKGSYLKPLPIMLCLNFLVCLIYPNSSSSNFVLKKQ